MGKILLVALLALGSCGGVPAVLDVTADRATYDAVAPAYLGYVDADPVLSAEAKQSRHDTVASWDLRIRKREEAIHPKPPDAAKPEGVPQP